MLPTNTITLLTQTPDGTTRTPVTPDDLMMRLREILSWMSRDGDVVVTVAPAMIANDDLTLSQIALLGTQVSECDGLATRSKNCLLNMGHHFVATLPFLTEEELRNIKNSGPVTQRDIRDFLASNGIGIGPRAQMKIDRYVIETFRVDPETLATLRRRLSLLGFSEEVVQILAECGIRTLASLVCRSEDEIRTLLKKEQKRREEWSRKLVAFDPDEVIEMIRGILQEYKLTFGAQEFLLLQSWIAM